MVVLVSCLHFNCLDRLNRIRRTFSTAPLCSYYHSCSVLPRAAQLDSTFLWTFGQLLKIKYANHQSKAKKKKKNSPKRVNIHFPQKSGSKVKQSNSNKNSTSIMKSNCTPLFFFFLFLLPLRERRFSFFLLFSSKRTRRIDRR